MGASLIQLETFVRVADLGNYTRVAEEFHLTQPGVTQHVRALERQYGVKLIDVVGRRPQLTDAGIFLAERARELLSTAQAIEREMGEFAAARAGNLHIGATLTIGTYVLPELLARFSSAAPAVRVHVEVANTVRTVERLRAGEISLALIEGPVTDQDHRLRIEPFQPDQLYLVVPIGHRFAARDSVTAAELTNEPFVWRESGSGTRAIAETALAHAGVHPPARLELPSGEGVARAVEAGLGVAILSRLVVEHAVAGGRLAMVTIADLDLARTFRLLSVRSRTLSPAARVFMELLRNSPQTSSSITPGGQSLLESVVHDHQAR